MKTKMLLIGLMALAFGSGCTTFCIAGVRESAKRTCAPGEAWETCVPKVETQLQATQDAVLQQLQAAASK